MTTGLQLRAALEGNLDEWQAGVVNVTEQAMMDGMAEMRDRGLQILRQSLHQAGLGALEKTWRATVFPKKGGSADPASWFYTKAEKIIRANQGEVIRSGRGVYLAIPIPGGPADNFPVRRSGTWGGKVDYAREKFGDDLFVIPARGDEPAILAVRNVRMNAKSGRLASRRARRRTSRTGKGQLQAGQDTFFLFWLVAQVTMPRRLDTKRDFERIGEMFARDYAPIVARLISDRLLGKSPAEFARQTARARR